MSVFEDGAILDRHWTPRAVIYLVLAAAVVIAPVLAVTGPPFLTAIVGIPAVLAAPGAALMGYFTIRDLGDEVLLVVVTSLLVTLLGAQLMLSLGIWHTELFAAVVALTSIPLIRHARRAAPVSPRTTRSALDAG